jgi:hypothetical protein
MLHIGLVLRVDLVLLDAEGRLSPVLPDLTIGQFLNGLPVLAPESFIIDFAILVSHLNNKPILSSKASPKMEREMIMWKDVKERRNSCLDQADSMS